MVLCGVVWRHNEDGRCRNVRVPGNVFYGRVRYLARNRFRSERRSDGMERPPEQTPAPYDAESASTANAAYPTDPSNSTVSPKPAYPLTNPPAEQQSQAGEANQQGQAGNGQTGPTEQAMPQYPGYPPYYPPAPPYWPTYPPDGSYPPPPPYAQMPPTPPYPPYGYPGYQGIQGYPGHMGYTGYPPYTPYQPPATGNAAPAGDPNAQQRLASVAAGSVQVAIFTKAVLPLLSLAVSFITYAWLFGWQFGIGIIVLLFIHEIGHYIIIRAKGLPASLPVFIPLIGAYVAMRRMPVSVRDEAEIALAGPAAGALSGIACYLLFLWTQVPILLPLAWFAFFLNLLNLVPVAPLDGGRIVGAISRWIWVAGLVLVAVAFVYIGNPTDRIILLILGWLGFTQLRSRFRESGPNASYYRISFWARAYVTLLYVGLAGALALGLLATQQTMAEHLMRLFS